MVSVADTVLSQGNTLLETKFSIPISRHLAVNVYSNTNPPNLKIAQLQKGLILVWNGKETVGEGAGFGLPVIVCPEDTYFSGSATVKLSSSSRSFTVRKVFSMDRVSRNKLGNVRLENPQARAFIKYLCELYQKNKRFRSILTLKQFIMHMGVEATFDETESVGKIPVTYEIRGNVLNVQLDLSQIERKHGRKFFVLNEQSASYFRKYFDSKGTTLVDGQVGAWDDAEAESACFTDMKGQFGFKLWQNSGAILRRGREVMRNCMDWVGLDYEVNPNIGFFQYKIELLGVKQTW